MFTNMPKLYYENLLQTLEFYGIKLFPNRDSYCYVDGLPLKDRPTEQHLYKSMALTCTVYNTAWSRWNLLAGEYNLVFQLKRDDISSEEGQVTRNFKFVQYYSMYINKYILYTIVIVKGLSFQLLY